MFDHLEEDWPWIVVPIVIVTVIALAVAHFYGADDGSLFTYTV